MEDIAGIMDTIEDMPLEGTMEDIMEDTLLVDTLEDTAVDTEVEHPGVGVVEVEAEVDVR